MEQQTDNKDNNNQYLKPSQQLAYKRVLAENKRLREQIVKYEEELQILRGFVGVRGAR